MRIAMSWLCVLAWNRDEHKDGVYAQAKSWSQVKNLYPLSYTLDRAGSENLAVSWRIHR